MRKCKECSKRIVGRADKIFCSAICKSKSHRTKHVSNPTLSAINRILESNYNIIMHLFSKTKALQLTVDHLTLSNQGFQFEYCTRIYLNSRGKWYRYVYDFRWMEFSDQRIKIYRVTTK